MNTGREVRLAVRPSGPVRAEHFSVVDAAHAGLHQDEVRVRPSHISLDPYLSIQMYGRVTKGGAFAPGDVISSRMIGTVTESRHEAFRPGDVVRGVAPWRTESCVPGSGLQKIDTGGMTRELFLSVLGTSGITAWVGLHRIGKTAPGETMIVSGAAGTVGSIAGQLARRAGCTVIGIAGGADKCAYVERHGMEFCLDHRAEDFRERLRSLSAQVYFENVGGGLLDAVLPALADHARIVLCGMIAHYDRDRPHTFRNLHLLLESAIDIRPFRVSEHAAVHAEALRDLSDAIGEGALTCAHTLVDGLDAAPEAFARVMSGRTLGKTVVRLAEADR